MLPTIEQRLATELAAQPKQVVAAIALLNEGATVPFIARYRKEATGGLSDIQLRLLEERLHYLRELEERRATIIAAIESQNKMSPELLTALTHVEDKTRLEDLYLPYKLKRRTKAQIALQAGLLPLADTLLNDPTRTPETEALRYITAPFSTPEGDQPGVPDVQAALEGARHILMEQFAENASLLNTLRTYLGTHLMVETTVVEGKQAIGEKFTDYFQYSERLHTIPSHRALAFFRGRREEILNLYCRLDTEPTKPKWSDPHNPCEQLIARQFNIQSKNRAADAWLLDTVRWAWRIKIFTHLETEFLTHLREQAETEAIHIFARNLKNLLLAAPAGPRVTLGLDPGLRTGVKVAVIDITGKIVDTTTVYPHAPKNDWQGALHTLSELIQKHNISLIAIGNGTASRETDTLAQELIQKNSALYINKVVVSEAGASVYSASELASKELPDLDVSLRGAVSIARRLQDPLAELVKIEPKSIGVGQYQHDVNQAQLARSLNAVVEDCVNLVGVDVNTASAALLGRVSGISQTIAHNMVMYRDQQGAFRSREALRNVPRLGEKTFEQAAGFLRITNGDNPLDASTVHPESYPLVQKLLSKIQKNILEVMGNEAFLKTLNPHHYTDSQFGLPTVTDILKELEKPGRDPRPEFSTATFSEQIKDIKDLTPDMILEGTVTNVAAFGAFVDIGVHQDGLVHISALSNTFVKNPHAVVQVGQIVKVKVLEVDLVRRRIALTMRLTDAASSSTRQAARAPHTPAPSQTKAPPNTVMEVAFAKLHKTS